MCALWRKATHMRQSFEQLTAPRQGVAKQGTTSASGSAGGEECLCHRGCGPLRCLKVPPGEAASISEGTDCHRYGN